MDIYLFNTYISSLLTLELELELLKFHVLAFLELQKSKTKFHKVQFLKNSIKQSYLYV